MSNKLEKALNAYNNNAFTHNYIVVAEQWKQTYAFFIDWNVIKEFATLDKSDGKIRLSITAYAVKTMRRKAWQIVPLAGHNAMAEKAAELTARDGANRNNGNGAEALVLEKYGQVWEWDNVPYTDGPDVWIDGVPYQIKSDKATFTTLKSLGM